MEYMVYIFFNTCNMKSNGVKTINSLPADT
jgi:hypothetical protein